MATYLTGTVTANLVAFSSGEVIDVELAALVHGDGTAADGAMQFIGGDYTVNVLGSVQGIGSNVRGMNFQSATGSHIVTVGANGTVYGTDGGIFVDAGNVLAILANAGSISTNSATTAAIDCNGDGDTTIDNSGVITSVNSDAIQFTGTGFQIVSNSGVITARAVGAYAISSTSTDIGSSVVIINNGLIYGNVSLGFGDDIVDSTFGSIDGKVELGFGADVYLGCDTTQFSDEVYAGQGDDTLHGNDGNDKLYGEAGDDTIFGDGGNDILVGGAHGDFGDILSYIDDGAGVSVNLSISEQQETGGAGFDTISGFENLVGTLDYSDTLTGDAFINSVSGFGGNDTLHGGVDAVADILIGGEGNDVYVVYSTDIITEVFDEGTADRVRAVQNFTLAADNYIEIMETINIAATTAIKLTGNDVFGQTLRGNAGINTLKGLGGNDTLYGYSGIDILDGGAGQDNLYGGAGNDRFDFNAVTDSGLSSATRDIVRDFAHGLDKIDLSTIDANTATSASAFGLLAKGTATSVVGSGKIGWYQVNAAGSANDMTILRINNDADASIEMTIQLKGLINLTSVDFVL